MAGYDAIFQAKTGKERVVLLLQLAEDKTARVQVNVDDIELAEPRWDWTRENRER